MHLLILINNSLSMGVTLVFELMALVVRFPSLFQFEGTQHSPRQVGFSIYISHSANGLIVFCFSASELRSSNQRTFYYSLLKDNHPSRLNSSICLASTFSDMLPRWSHVKQEEHASCLFEKVFSFSPNALLGDEKVNTSWLTPYSNLSTSGIRCLLGIGWVFHPTMFHPLNWWCGKDLFYFVFHFFHSNPLGQTISSAVTNGEQIDYSTNAFWTIKWFLHLGIVIKYDKWNH